MADASDGRTLIRAERGPGRNYDLYDTPDRANIHVDGVSGFGIGPALTRIDFHTIERVEDQPGSEEGPIEIRARSVTLVIPTAAFAEFVVNAVNSLRGNQQKIIAALEGQAAAVKEFLRLLGVADATEK